MKALSVDRVSTKWIRIASSLLAPCLFLACGNDKPSPSVPLVQVEKSPTAKLLTGCAESKITSTGLRFRSMQPVKVCRVPLATPKAEAANDGETVAEPLPENVAESVEIYPAFSIVNGAAEGSFQTAVRSEGARDGARDGARESAKEDGAAGRAASHASLRKLEIRQSVGFYLPDEAKEMTAPQRIEREAAVGARLNQKCRPIIEGILGRSGFRAVISFQSIKETDRLVNGGASEGGLHAMLPLRHDVKRGISIADEIAPVWSGVGSPDESQSFCAQLALRIVEGLGVVAGRDCNCRLGLETCDVADGGKGSNQKGGPGLTKMTDPTQIAVVGKLNRGEVKQILEPICGSLDLEKKSEKKPEQSSEQRSEKKSEQ